MAAKYLIRLDDACPTMDNHKWSIVEWVLDKFMIKPIVAVVPDNHDPHLVVDHVDWTFWDKVRSWQKKGWTVAMHGYRHVMHRVSRRNLVLPFYDLSEFSGLPYDEQAKKIRASMRIFSMERVEPKVWIAPAHCFDWLTIQAVANETPIRMISDGIARDAYFNKGFVWIPQQLWELRERNAGLWTVCLHPNSMSEREIALLGEMIETRYVGRIRPLGDLELVKRSKTSVDHVYNAYFWQRRRALTAVKHLRTLLNG